MGKGKREGKRERKRYEKDIRVETERAKKGTQGEGEIERE